MAGLESRFEPNRPGTGPGQLCPENYLKEALRKEYPYGRTPKRTWEPERTTSERRPHQELASPYPTHDQPSRARIASTNLPDQLGLTQGDFETFLRPAGLARSDVSQ